MKIYAHRAGEHLIITAPADLLVHAFINHPDWENYKVVDKDLFIMDIINELNNGSSIMAGESGLTDLEYFFDKIMNQVGSGGSESIEEK